ncbi:MAG: pseudouridine synthase [Pseudomonadota bacterium]
MTSRDSSRAGPERADAPGKTGERIAKRLARAGVASRRGAEAMIAEGRVRVNGRRIDSPALDVREGDLIELDGQPLPEAEPPRLWRYHKPVGLVTTARDEKGRPTVFERLPEGMPRVMSVGRLDLTSEGLLLLTNDGELKRRLELPSTGWLRRYRVRVHGRPTEADLAPLERGIEVEGERFRPMTASLDRQQGANAWLTVGLREGRNREVRRALGALGFDVSRLIRVSYGPFQLGDLEPGETEEIKAKVLRDQIGAAAGPPPEERDGRAARRRGGAEKDRGRDRGEGDGAKPTRRGGGAGGPRDGHGPRGSRGPGGQGGGGRGAPGGKGSRRR